MNSNPTRYVVTRPAPDHRSLIDALGNVGVPVIHAPAFELEPEPESRLSRCLSDLAACDLAVVTSPFAARLLAGHGGVGQVRDLKFITPGRGTAAVLDAAGISAEYPSAGGTSEHVLAMPELENVSGKRIAIVGAPGGRGALARGLAARGVAVEKLHVYHRRPLPACSKLVEALRDETELVNLVSSIQIFSGILHGLPGPLRRAWLDSRFIVSSGRIEQACRDAGAFRICQADGACDAAMLSAAVRAGWLGAPPSPDFR